MHPSSSIPRHVAIIMDGNGRWAKARGQHRLMGHAEGAKAVRHAVETSVRLGISYLTLYAFSVNNWSRPTDEVSGLMDLMVSFAKSEAAELRETGVAVQVIGQPERLPPHTRAAIDELMSTTATGTKMTLTLALSYGGREDVLIGVRRLAEQLALGRLDGSDVDFRALRRAMSTSKLPDVDLLIRTGGESRISDFLLLEAAYAELLFLPIMWPDFTPEVLRAAVAHYQDKERRFGLTSEQVRTKEAAASRF
jgi:undecaprenyl diphosphate synthase